MYLRCDRLPERYPRQPVSACVAFEPPTAGRLKVITPEGERQIPLRWLTASPRTSSTEPLTRPLPLPLTRPLPLPLTQPLNTPLSPEALRALTGGGALPRPAQHPGDALTLTPHAHGGAGAGEVWALAWRALPARDITLAFALRPLTDSERGALEPREGFIARVSLEVD